MMRIESDLEVVEIENDRRFDPFNDDYTVTAHGSGVSVKFISIDPLLLSTKLRVTIEEVCE